MALGFYPSHTFQSTLPARGATCSPRKTCVPRHNFNPRSPHGERLHQRHQRGFGRAISIHAPRTGSDPIQREVMVVTDYDFNPRSPHGERHPAAGDWDNYCLISIHAPRTGSDDASGFPKRHSVKRFQSTLPARGATKSQKKCGKGIAFQSTLPARGATRDSRPRCPDPPISIHAPRTGSDEL